MKKIYIIGPVGSGKTIFSKALSKKSWDDEIHIKRTDDEAMKII